jgi:thioredoxin-dependent peroxiredoxin
MDLKAGQTAPDFLLPDQDGQRHKLSDYLGKWVLLYFYPKDDTEGCIAEACGLRDSLADFSSLGAKVLGVSADSVESHRKFAEKFGLPFTLLADPERRAIGAYGVWGEKEMAGKKFMGIFRTSFLIDPTGKIVKIYEKVKPLGHAPEVLADLRSYAQTP